MQLNTKTAKLLQVNSSTTVKPKSNRMLESATVHCESKDMISSVIERLEGMVLSRILNMGC